MNPRIVRTLGLLGVAVLLLGVGIRIWNAIHYPILMGYDAKGNWLYIASVLETWTLPDPSHSWSAAHPPLFYFSAAAISAFFDEPGRNVSIQIIRSFGIAMGLGIVALSFLLLRRTDVTSPLRRFLAPFLLLFLPVHLYMCTMLSEEIWVSLFISASLVGVTLEVSRSEARAGANLRAFFFGALAGLALLTKLSGALAVVAGGAAYLIHAWRNDRLPDGVKRALVFGLGAALFGGWYYLRSLWLYGYLYPHGLEVHSVMFEMPPGSRGLLDYLRLPLALFTEPDLLSPKLIHSVWAGTFANVWFDGHSHFLPLRDPRVRDLGSLLLVLGLLPTAAFAIGLSRGVRRAFRERSGPDMPMVLLVGMTLAGYILFTWRNPQFVTVKASFLLGLSVPFAYYTSEVLADWTLPRASANLARRWAIAVVTWIWLAMLVASVTTGFTFGLAFTKQEMPGLDWKTMEPRWQP